MAFKSILFSKIIGLIVAVSGILLNPTFLGKLLSTDGQIEQLRFQIIILCFEGVIVIVGLCLFLFPKFLARNWRLLFSSVLAIFAAFIVVEFSARLFLDRPAFGWYGYPSGLYVPDKTKGFGFTPNFKGYFLNPPFDHIPININSHGLRDLEHNYEKPKGVTRIVGLGDSVTFGPGITLEETYLSQLEGLLKQKGVFAEVIKAGVNSYTFDQEYAYYLEEGYRYDPNIVIVGVLHKDIQAVTSKEIADLYESTKKAQDSQKNEKEKASVIHKLRLQCRTCDVLYMLFDFLSHYSDRDVLYEDNWTAKWENPENWERYSAKLLDLHTRLKRDGDKLVLVIFPFTEQFRAANQGERLFQAKLVEFGKKENIPVLDLLPILNVSSFYNYYLGGDSVHLNARGHRVVGEALQQFILKSNALLP